MGGRERGKGEKRGRIEVEGEKEERKSILPAVCLETRSIGFSCRSLRVRLTLYTYIHTSIHTYIHTYKHTYIHTVEPL